MRMKHGDSYIYVTGNNDEKIRNEKEKEVSEKTGRNVMQNQGCQRKGKLKDRWGVNHIR